MRDAREARAELERRGIELDEWTFKRRVSLGDLETVELFLAAGMDPDVRDHVLPVLAQAVSEGHAGVVRRLLRAGASLAGGLGEDYLILAAAGDHPEIVRVLLDAGVEPDARERDCHPNRDETGLMYAARLGNRLEVARLLLDAGADPDLKNRYGATAFDLAVSRGHRQVADLLRQAGARDGGYVQSELHAAVMGGDLAAIRSAVERGAAVDVVDADGRAPLQAAAYAGRADVVRELLGLGAEATATGAAATGVTATGVTAAEVTAESSPGSMALHHAAGEAKIEIVELLLAAGVDVNVAASFGETALEAAAARGHLAVIEMLLKAGAGVGHRDGYGRTALHHACDEDSGHPGAVQLLLAAGADPDADDEEGARPLNRCLYEQHFECARLLLKAGADPNLRSWGGTALHVAIWHAGIPELLSELLAAGADLEARDEEGMTPLLAAIIHAFEDGVPELLLELGADLHARDAAGRTALEIAVTWDRGEIARQLVDAGLDPQELPPAAALHWYAEQDQAPAVRRLLSACSPDGRDRHGATPLMRAALAGAAGAVRALLAAGADTVAHGELVAMTPLDWAIEGGHPEVLEILLEATRTAGQPVRNVYGETPLHQAAGAGHSGAIEALLARGEDPDARGPDQGTPLMQAAICGHPEAARALLAGGASVDARNRGGGTALTSAAWGGDVACLRLLTSAGADLEARDDNRHTALWYAARRGHSAAADYLLAQGADPAVRRTADLVGAIETGDLPGVERLIHEGTPVDERDEEGLTPLLRAARLGHRVIAERLMAAGADLAARDSEGGDLAHNASGWGHRELGDWLARRLERSGDDSR